MKYLQVEHFSEGAGLNRMHTRTLSLIFFLAVCSLVYIIRTLEAWTGRFDLRWVGRWMGDWVNSNFNGTGGDG